MTLEALIYQGERVMGIEPTYQAWEARLLPLNYTRDDCSRILQDDAAPVNHGRHYSHSMLAGGLVEMS